MNNLDEVELTKQLVKIESVIGSEQDISQYIQEYIEKQIGITPTIQEIEPGRFNVCASFGKMRKGILFTGHVDTVQLGIDVKKSLGSEGLIENKKVIYGRGTSDMKGGISAILVAFREFIKNNQNNEENVKKMQWHLP